MAALLLGAVLGQPTSAADPEQVKQLYEAAEYDRVLSIVASREIREALTVEVRQYVALSLLALSRITEAEQEIALLFEADPLYVAADAASPRWKAIVERVRTRVWPGIIKARYESAKRRFDDREFTKAVPELEALQTLLAAGRRSGVPGLDDLITLADGFLKLSRDAISAPGPVARDVEAPPPAVVATASVRKPPVAIRREFPTWNRPPGIPAWQVIEGRISLAIGADGSVTSVRIVDSVHPFYDAALAAAAKKWRFEPATENGLPIPFELEVHVVLNSGAPEKR